MIATFSLRARHVVFAVVVGLVLAAAGLVASGALATPETPVVAGVQLSAPLNEPVPAYDGYQGWGTVTSRATSYTAEFAPLRAVPVDAWRWNSRFGWMHSSRNAGARVYIYPYASGWSWTWTEGQGWLAMRTSNLWIGYRPVAIAT